MEVVVLHPRLNVLILVDHIGAHFMHKFASHIKEFFPTDAEIVHLASTEMEKLALQPHQIHFDRIHISVQTIVYATSMLCAINIQIRQLAAFVRRDILEMDLVRTAVLSRQSTLAQLFGVETVELV